ncbi:MAG: single-stranded DNA-binding protein [Fimbriimonadaceae bacterium]|nr:single-stranded DNA-binding protein [Chitinophagales bacterium]
MSGINKVILIGNLGKDPELRNFEGGNVVANFPLATTEVYRDKNQNKVEHTEWHNISMWGKLAEVASKFLRKGSKVYIEGRIKNRSWEDKEGNKKYITEIVAENFTMLDKRPATGNNEEPVAQESTSASNSDMQMADDLPF